MSNDRSAPNQYESEVLKLMAVKQETIKRAIETLGPKKIVAALSQEDLLAALRKEDVLQYFLAELGLDQLQQMIVKISRNQAESH